MVAWRIHNGAVALYISKGNYQLVVGKSAEHIRGGGKNTHQSVERAKRRTIHALTGSAEAVLRPDGEVVYLEGDITIKVEQDESTRRRTLVSVDGSYRRVVPETSARRIVKDEEFSF